MAKVSSATLADAVTKDRFRLYKLDGCDPDLRLKIRKVLLAMDALGWPMLVTDGARSTDEQRSLYARGRTKPGAIVTNADGVTTLSNHQSGKACDCCFVVDDRPSWDARLPWATYGSCLKAVGLKWGGDWSKVSGKKGLVDLPHAELP